MNLKHNSIRRRADGTRIYPEADYVELMHARAEFEAGRLSEEVAEPSGQGDGWRFLFLTESGETLVLTDHSGRERLYHTT